MSRGRPPKNTDKADRIIAKVCEQFYRWGFSGSDFNPIVAKAALKTLSRSPTDDPEEGDLSAESVKKIYLAWKKEERDNNKEIWGVEWNNFLRSRYAKASLSSGSPKLNQLYEVAVFFMEYMNQNPEECIFKNPPQCPEPEKCWWRFRDGVDGDLQLSPRQKKKISKFPTIKKKK